MLIDRGRRTARQRRFRRGRKVAIASAAGLVVLIIGAVIVFRQGPSWPPSVATVKRQITVACQNPNVVSEPSAAGVPDRAEGFPDKHPPLRLADSAGRHRRLRGDGQGPADPGAAAVPGRGQR